METLREKTEREIDEALTAIEADCRPEICDELALEVLRSAKAVLSVASPGTGIEDEAIQRASLVVELASIYRMGLASKLGELAADIRTCAVHAAEHVHSRDAAQRLLSLRTVAEARV